MTHNDFDKVAEGGCHNQCNVLLVCGHVCQRLCHVNLDNHEDYNCKEKCGKLVLNEFFSMCSLCNISSIFYF